MRQLIVAVSLGVGLDGGVEAGVLQAVAHGEEELEQTGDENDEEEEGEEGQGRNGSDKAETGYATVPEVLVQQLSDVSMTFLV